MTEIRFLFDDIGQSQVQKSILRVFAADLERQSLGKIVWSSDIPEFLQWQDVSVESSKRLGLRLFALQPKERQLTVFFPGHLVPGRLGQPIHIKYTLASTNFISVSGLDLFVVDNSAPELKQYQYFITTNPDYESISNYADFSVTELPDWLVSNGLKSCLRLTDRPWYTLYAPARIEWLEWVKRTLKEGELTVSMVQEDIKNGLVRPSLLDDIECLSNNIPLPSFSTSEVDSIFVFPECRLSDTQRKLLYSKTLQARLIEIASQKTARKLRQQNKKHSWKFHARKLVNKLLKSRYLGLNAIYKFVLRPMANRISYWNGSK